MKQFLELLIGNEGLPATMAFIVFALFGMTFYKVFRFQKKKKLGLRATPPVYVVFNWKTWKADNILDYVLTFMVAFAFFRFFPDALSFLGDKMELPAFTDKMAYGLFLGIVFQIFFHKLLNSTKLPMK